MALKLTLSVSSPLLQNAAVQTLDYYVKVGALNFNAFTNKGAIPLAYCAFDAFGQPTNQWLTGLPLPTAAPIMRPRELMMDNSINTFQHAYRVAYDYLIACCGESDTVENLV